MATLMGASVVGPRLLAASFNPISTVSDRPDDFSADDRCGGLVGDEAGETGADLLGEEGTGEKEGDCY